MSSWVRTMMPRSGRTARTMPWIPCHSRSGPPHVIVCAAAALAAPARRHAVKAPTPTRTSSALTMTTAFHALISPLGSPRGAPWLARRPSFHRSARREARLGSHGGPHFTARLAARRALARTAALISVHVLVGRRRFDLLLVQLLDFGEQEVDIAPGGAATSRPACADVALAIDQEFDVRRLGEPPIRGDDIGAPFGGDRKQDARGVAELLDRVGWGIGGPGGDPDAAGGERPGRPRPSGQTPTCRRA